MSLCLSWTDSLIMRGKREATNSRKPKGNQPIHDLYFMYEVWKNTIYHPKDVAFRIRAVTLARIECQIYHAQLEEEETMATSYLERMEKLTRIHRDPSLDQMPCTQCGHEKGSHIDHIDARPGRCAAWVAPEGFIDNYS